MKTLLVNFLLLSGILTSSKIGATSFSGQVSPPPHLVEFSISYYNNLAKVSFTTASEQELEGFLVEVSKDGFCWQELALLKANGTAFSTSSYQVEDKNPFIGTSYYRVRSISNAGEKHELAFMSGEYHSYNYLSYPVPVNTDMYLEGDKLADSEVTVYNSLGEKVEVENVFLGDKMNFNFSDIKSGVYFLEIENDHNKRIEKISVVHK